MILPLIALVGLVVGTLAGTQVRLIRTITVAVVFMIALPVVFMLANVLLDPALGTITLTMMLAFGTPFLLGLFLAAGLRRMSARRDARR